MPKTFTITRILFLQGIIFVLASPVTTQRKTHAEPQVHNTVKLPAAAHKKGLTAGFFLDPITGNKVYRLSDRNLCPSGATHFYSYTNQFSPQGRMVFDCLQARYPPRIFPVYGPDFRLEYDDAIAAAHVPGSGTGLADVQWSQEREVLYARANGMVLELDPIAHKTRGVVNFLQRMEGFVLPNGQKVPITGLDALSVGPGDRLMVHLLCRHSDPGCTPKSGVIGIGVFDPATGKAHALYVPVPGDRAPAGFDEAHWTQNPKGRLVVIYTDAPNFIYNADLSARVQIDDNHGHTGYFCGSNGRCYLTRVRGDTLPRGGVGQIGCRKPNGDLSPPWQSEEGLYDDETGKRVLIWGCDVPGQTLYEHIARHAGAKDVLGASTERYTFAPSLEKFFPTDEAIVRGVLEYAGGEPARVRLTPVAYHRSASGPRAQLMGRECDYWAQPRMVMDFTGNRFLFESTMSHPEWPSIEDGKVRTDCVTDVYVAEFSDKPSAPPAAR
ncbi:MAG TPA: hypothetical protein VGR03_12520 [Candidatus Acidoferrum sp.]|nr:hypothetical protein [Candidatus Acidoferrum sp.]